jgi:uncharacterized protein YqjF (DUF2071 family)
VIHLLKRHPFAVRAHFDAVLVLTYALPAEVLRPALAPGLEVDSWGDDGFVAVALVWTRRLRPAVLPAALGRSFFLSGTRIFSRYTTPAGRRLRGLRILRSDTDRRSMVWAGNLLTHYRYHLAEVEIDRRPQEVAVRVTSRDGHGDVVLRARLDGPAGWLPPGSPFDDERTARRFVGPMPFTFDYESETHSILRVEGVRPEWRPRLVPVEVDELSFLRHRFPEASPRLASAFWLEEVDYRWKRGVREPLPESTGPGA